MANYKQLYVFVEGPDDTRFINSVVTSELISKYDNVKIIEYACKIQNDISKLISVIKKQTSSDYIFICDMDARGDKSLCVTNRKKKVIEKFNVVEPERIVVVKEEIESWYLSGISASNIIKHKIKRFNDTEHVTKEDFEKMIPKRSNSVTDFMIEVLKDYSLIQAITTNGSLNYFFRKHIK